MSGFFYDKKKKYLVMKKLCFTIWLLLIATTFAANYYVDYNAAGNNDGTSWQDAWTTFANINWAIIQPGDTIYISQGTYNERMEVSGSGGISGNPVVISKAIDVNHNGDVIILNSGIHSSGVKINSFSSTKSYIVINGLTIKNFKYGLKLLGESNQLHDISIKNCSIVNFTRAGVYVSGFSNIGNVFNVEVDNCSFNSIDNYTLQTDCIYMQYTDGITISNNYLYIDNIDLGGHNDLIQIFVGNNGKVYNNIGIHNDGKTRNCQGFFFELVTGTYYVYNNSIHLSNNGHALDSKIYFKQNSTAHTVILNNSIYGYSGDLISTSDSAATIKNNILYTEGFGATGSEYIITFTNGRGGSADVDYNCYYDPSNTMLNISNGIIGPHSIEANPMLKDINIPTLDFDLNSSSPCIDVGTDMSSVFTFDIHQNSRPLGSAWDMGDNEYNSSFPVELTSFTVVLDSERAYIKWKTATEVNNYGFEVERKVNSQNWQTLGFVEGHGNSNSPKEYSFSDIDVNMAGVYTYRLKQIDNDGSYEYSKAIEVNLGVPNKIELKQNYPNPFNPSTTIHFTIPIHEFVSLRVFNLLGEEVETIYEGMLEAGVYTYNFNAKGLPSGIYVYKLSTKNYVQAKKMLILK